MPIMIWIAIIVEFAIQNWIDAGILLGIQFANATLGWCAPAPATRLTHSGPCQLDCLFFLRRTAPLPGTPACRPRLPRLL